MDIIARKQAYTLAAEAFRAAATMPGADVRSLTLSFGDDGAVVVRASVRTSQNKRLIDTYSHDRELGLEWLSLDPVD
jgi:hypothetical protein